jgi:hypothetical protein
MEFVIAFVSLWIFGVVLLYKAQKAHSKTIDELIAARGEAAKWKSIAKLYGYCERKEE